MADHQHDLPLSGFAPRPFSDHPVGSVLLLTPWSGKPAKLCLGVKIGGFKIEGEEVEAIFILQGAPYGGSEDLCGQIIHEVHYLKRRGDLFLGMECEVTLGVDLNELADFSQNRSWRYAPGSLALSSAGYWICGGLDRSRCMAINPASWTVEGTPPADEHGLIDSWSLVLHPPGIEAIRVQITGLKTKPV